MGLKRLDIFPELESKRIRLRQLEESDKHRFYEIFQDEEVMKDYGIAPHKTIEESQELMEKLRQNYETGKSIRWAIVLKETNQYIGSCGFHRFNTECTKAEIGYELHPDEWGKGYMSEAVRTILKFGFDMLSLARIEGIVHDDNESSKVLLRHLGFTYEGCLRKRFYDRGRLCDEHYFSLLQEEYASIYENRT